MGMPPSSRTTVAPLRRTRSVHLDARQLRQLQHRGADATRGSVNQHTLSGPGLRRSMQHLIRGDVVQHHGGAQGSVAFDADTYRPVLTERSRGGKKRVRLVLQSRKAAFKSDVKDLEVGITVLTVLDGDANLTLAATIDNSRIPFYDFEAKIVVPGRKLATTSLSVGD